MRMYDCTVRLNGDTSSEVFKQGVTAPEIVVLRHIHGSDAVVRIIPKNRATASHAAERERLMHLYEGGKENKVGMIVQLFGPPHIPLMEELDPATEATLQAAAEAADAFEAAKQAEIDAEVERRLQIALQAQKDAETTEEKNTSIVNEDAGSGWSPEKIAEIALKREAGVARLKAEREAT